LVALRVILLLAGALCALGLAWMAVGTFAFGRGYGQPVAALLPVCAAMLAAAAAMGWVVLRFWRGGFGQRGPRRVALGLAAVGAGLALWSGLADPGDAVFTLPVLLGVSGLFAVLAALRPQG